MGLCLTLKGFTNWSVSINFEQVDAGWVELTSRYYKNQYTTLRIFTCSTSAIKTLEKGVKHVQSFNKNTFF